MTDYKNHLIGGLVVIILVLAGDFWLNYYDLTLLGYLIGVPIILGFSLLPDIDIATSKIHKLFILIAMLLIIYFVLFNRHLYAVVVALLVIIASALKHRKETHTIAFGFVLALVVGIFLGDFINITTGIIIGFGAFLGFLSHSVLDWHWELI